MFKKTADLVAVRPQIGLSSLTLLRIWENVVFLLLYLAPPSPRVRLAPTMSILASPKTVTWMLKVHKEIPPSGFLEWIKPDGPLGCSPSHRRM